MYSKDELKNLKLEFWESFAAYCEVQPYLRDRKKIWTLYDTKVKGVELKFDVSRNGAYVILEVNHRNGFSRRVDLGYLFCPGNRKRSCTYLHCQRRNRFSPQTRLGRIFYFYGVANVFTGA